MGETSRVIEDSICSVCMEYPHNAVLLLCSSHEKGCRPYMCGTSFRYSNCLDMYRKASTTKLGCPLCRGQVKGWSVVEAARQHFNGKKRSCVQDDCSFSGTYRQLRKHMRVDHPFAKPREVDHSVEEKWRRVGRERERADIMSNIRSSSVPPLGGSLMSVVLEGYGYPGSGSTSLASRLRRQGRILLRRPRGRTCRRWPM